VLFIDTQKFNCSKEGAIYRSLSPEEQEGCAYFYETLEVVLPRWQKLQEACREGAVEVIYTVIQSLTKDGRDMSLDYKISGFKVPPGSLDAEVLDELKPGEDEIVLPKTSCNVFVSTNIDYVLRCLGVKSLVICGCVTDQCVDVAVRSACDLGYLVTLLPDCCITYSQKRHDNALSALRGFCRQRASSELIAEVKAATTASASKRQKQ